MQNVQKIIKIEQMKTYDVRRTTCMVGNHVSDDSLCFWHFFRVRHIKIVKHIFCQKKHVAKKREMMQKTTCLAIQYQVTPPGIPSHQPSSHTQCISPPKTVPIFWPSSLLTARDWWLVSWGASSVGQLSQVWASAARLLLLLSTGLHWGSIQPSSTSPSSIFPNTLSYWT